MTTDVKLAPKFIVHTLSTNDTLVVVVPKELRKEFNDLVQRGANMWPDSSPSMKEFADMVTSNQVMQDYHSQPS